MILSRSPREEIHQRRIDLKFYRRADGLYEVEGQLIDTKSHDFQRVLHSGCTPAGEHLHHITVTLVIDGEMRVLDASACMQATPFDICPNAAQALAKLRGLTLAAGWNRKVRELLGGSASCTHIVELLGPMATTAFQGLAPQRLTAQSHPDNEHLRIKRVNSCYAYADNNAVVAQLWPHLSQPSK